jgi:pyruvate dehydrogenase E2 component (dihydrolipoamide acetyltransferase)
MSTNVIMPQMGESVAEGTVVKWFKKPGDHVDRDEPLLEISTDKVDAEIPSPAAGVLGEILVQENETVEVNTVLAVIDGEGAAVATVESAAEPTGPSPAPLPSSPPALTAPTPASAVEPPSAASIQPAPDEVRRSETTDSAESQNEVRSSPLVRRIAREHNVNLARVRGTGLGGRISKKDVLAYIGQGQPVAGAAPAGGTPTGPGVAQPPAAPPSSSPAVTSQMPEIAFAGPTYSVPMTPMRKQIAEHMVLSRRTSAHVTTVFEVEMSRVVELRARQAEEFERRNGIKLTYTPFMVRAAAEAIKQFPVFNASVDGSNIVYKKSINVGIAVALETGLIVPVIKQAEEKNLLGIARALQDLAERARTKRLSVDDVQGGTFTLTNPGIFGSLFGTPIINQPQVAILGVGVIEKRAVVRNDAIAIRPMVYLALSFDHRLIDGAMADQFMARIKSKLENWDEDVL